MTRLSGAVGSVALLLGVTLLSPSATAEPGQGPSPAVAPVPEITWESCAEEWGDRAECATAPVPLDHDEPTGETIELDLLRMPATDPARRIGTLFVNPGGPGAPSRAFASYFGMLVSAEVSERFDIVGVDPRGVGPSTPMVCRTSERQPRSPGSPSP